VEIAFATSNKIFLPRYKGIHLDECSEIFKAICSTDMLKNFRKTAEWELLVSFL